MNLMAVLFPFAQAAPAPAAPGMGMFLPIIILFAVMYFFMMRPQMKKQKEHKAMLEKITKGNEVLTSGGIAGVVTAVGEHFITIEVADKVCIRVQKNAIGNVLPTGTLKSAV